MNGWRAVSIVLAGLVLVGCTTTPTPSPEPVAANGAAAAACAEVIRVEAVFLCPQMIALATAKLGLLHAPIVATRFRRDLCPPNARCLLALPNRGYVIFTFQFGDPVMVRVTPMLDASGAETLVLTADEPEPLPEWLLEELNDAAGPS